MNIHQHLEIGRLYKSNYEFIGEREDTHEAVSIPAQSIMLYLGKEELFHYRLYRFLIDDKKIRLHQLDLEVGNVKLAL